MLLDPTQPNVRHSSRFGAVLLLSLHADPATVVGSPQNGGVTVYVRELARALAAQGYGVDIVTRRQSPADPSVQPYHGARILRIDAGPAEPCGNDEIAQYLPQACEAVLQLCKRRAYRFISSHYWLSGIIGERAARENGIPHLHTLHSHGVERKERSAITQARIEAERCLLQSAEIVTLSAAHPKLYRSHYGIERPVHVIPAGVDTGRFMPGDRDTALRQLGLSPAQTWIGYIGRLSKEKGIDDLLCAFALLHRRNPKAALFVVGGAASNSRVPELRRLTQHLHVAGAVKFLGPVPNASVHAAFQAADVIAIPSHYEAFGLVALEARAAGAAIVAADVGGLRELVDERSGGERVAPGDFLAWADALERATTPRILTERRRKALEMHDDGVHSWAGIASQIADIAHAAPAAHG